MLKKNFLGHRLQLLHLFGVLFLLTRTIHFASAFIVTSPTSSTILRPPITTTTSTSTTTTNSNYQLLFDTQLHNSLHSEEEEEEIISSADVDSDEDAEQRLGDDGTIINDDGEGFSVDSSSPVNGNNGSRFEGLLSSVGLEGKLTHVTDLPAERKVSTYDIFCNREIKLGNCKAIGFDMDYTLAQYQQPAFDQLGFDGTKEKLVNQLG